MKTIKRVLIKLSGGALASNNGDNFDHEKLDHIANEILSIADMDIEVALVVGGAISFAENWQSNGILTGLKRITSEHSGPS